MLVTGFNLQSDVFLSNNEIDNIDIYSYLINYFNYNLKIDPLALNNPNDYYFYQNYPNPFNPITTIKYDLLKPTKVSLKIFNILGQEIITLVNTFENSGTKSVIWDGKNNKDKSVGTGIYIYQIQSRKMIFLK